MRCNFLFLLTVILASALSSQTYNFDNYTVKNGLSQSTVYSMVQDREGYLWIGNKSGISRFDGIGFENYSTKDGIAGNGVRSIFIDSSGVIWFGHIGGGLTIRRNDRFEVVILDSNILTSEVSGIAQDNRGRIWITSTENGVFRINNPVQIGKEAIDYDHFSAKTGLSDRVFEITVTNSGLIYFITDVGIKKFSESDEKFELHAPENLSKFFAITTVYVDAKDNTWYGTYNGGLYREDAKSHAIKIFDVRDGLAFNWISTINEDEKGRIWIGTWGGGITMIEGDRLLTFNDKNGLPDLKIFEIINDREGNVLIGTNETGLFIYKGDRFVAFSEKNGLSSNQVWAIEEDRFGKIWLGTSVGITILEKIDGAYEYSYINEESNNFISDDIRFIKKDENGDMWIGTNGGVIKANPSKPQGPYEYSGRINSNIRFQLVTAMDIDKFNNLWIGTLEGLIYYEIDTKAMSYLTKMNGLADNEISEVYCDSKGDVWVGCKGKGLTLIRDTNFINIDLGGEITPNSIREDKNGNIWIGTDGQGLFISKNAETITESFTVEDGLLANLINLIEVDDENNIWIGTNKGLNKFDRQTNEITSYDESDGFTGIETRAHASLADKEGKMWFGTVNGVMRYDRKRDDNKSLKPLVQVNRLRVNLEEREINQNEKFTYKEKSFYFDFKGIYLTNPTSVKYRYKLEGIDEKWSESSKLTFANYPVLPDGNYTFMVMASNNSGKWTVDEEIARYSFIITPPFWKTWWFYVFCVVFIGSWIVFLIKKREENLLIEKRLLEAKVAERTAELAAKNKDITDSIRYAERIQRAILPPDELIKSALPDSFVFYRPKDIVSGDFYWINPGEDKVLFSAIDCTGHGVPGAFMSIVGHNLLDKIVKEEKYRTPSEILDRLNNSVSTTLRQTSESDAVKDGMDMALLGLDFKNNKLEYAGANNGVYIIRNGELIETKGNRFAIGSFIRGEKRKFDNHTFDLQKGDLIYVFSDGYPDQFGGESGKKYKYKPFKEFLLSIHEKSMSEQHKLLEQDFINWLGDYSQIDDVLVIGVRV